MGVQEYILVGPADSSMCGDIYGTWGKVPSLRQKSAWVKRDKDRTNADEEEEEEEDEEEEENVIIVGESEQERLGGFVRRDVSEFDGLCLCRFDHSLYQGFSKVVTFSR
jgi:hypothetical protein